MVNEWTAKLGLVAAGLGITLLPSLAAEAARGDVALAALSRDDASPRGVYAVTLARRVNPPAAAVFVTVLLATARRIRGGRTPTARPAAHRPGGDARA